MWARTAASDALARLEGTAHAISDATWTALENHLADDQRLGLIFTVGGYQLLALVVNTLDIQPEHD